MSPPLFLTCTSCQPPLPLTQDPMGIADCAARPCNGDADSGSERGERPRLRGLGRGPRPMEEGRGEKGKGGEGLVEKEANSSCHRPESNGITETDKAVAPRPLSPSALLFLGRWVGYMTRQAADWALGSPISLSSFTTAVCLFCMARSKGVLESASRALHSSSLFGPRSRKRRITWGRHEEREAQNPRRREAERNDLPGFFEQNATHRHGNLPPLSGTSPMLLARAL